MEEKKKKTKNKRALKFHAIQNEQKQPSPSSLYFLTLNLNIFAGAVKSYAISSNKISLKLYKMTIVSLAENAYTEPLGPVNYMWLAKNF